MPLSLNIAMPPLWANADGNPACVADEIIRVVNPLQMDDWDDQVHRLPGNTFFHGSAWLRVLHETYGFEPCCIAEYQGRQLTALLPLVEVRSRLTGNRGVALPFADFCPLLAADPATEQSLIERAIELGKTRRWKTIEWRGASGQRSEISNPPSALRPLSSDLRPLPPVSSSCPNLTSDLCPLTSSLVPPSDPCSLLAAPCSLLFLTHTLDLKPGEDRLYHRFESSVRRAIRKAENLGVKATVTNSAGAMENFHQLYCITRQRHGLPPQPRKFFRNIHQQIIAQGKGFIVEATHNSIPIASAIFFTSGKQALYKYGASNHEAQDLRANNLLMWTAIKTLISRGFDSLHFGRTSLENEGLRRFKNSWATVEDQVHYCCYDLHRGQYIAQLDNAHGWHTRVFQKVPISLARIIGSLLYQHTA